MDPTMIGLIILMVAVFYFLMIRPQQKKQKEQQAMQRSLGPGSTVMLASGVYGEIVDSSGKDTSVVRIADGVEITVLKQAIVKQVPASEFPGASVPAEFEDTDEPIGPADQIDRQSVTRQDEAAETEFGENLTGADGSSSGYDAPGSATRSRITDGQGGSSALGSAGQTGERDSGSAVDGTSDDENPNNPKA